MGLWRFCTPRCSALWNTPNATAGASDTRCSFLQIITRSPRIIALLRGRMRWFRLLLLGLASIYPLYWTAQFLLYFAPEALLGLGLGQPIHVISISYLQATAVTHPHPVFPAHWEAMVSASTFSLLVLALRGDRFVTGGFSIVVFGQSALLPFINLLSSRGESSGLAIFGAFVAFLLIVL